MYNSPVVCPVCSGRGEVAANFYDFLEEYRNAKVKCKTCSGSGVLWPPNAYYPQPYYPYPTKPYYPTIVYNTSNGSDLRDSVVSRTAGR